MSFLLCNLLHNKKLQYFSGIIYLKSDPSVANMLSDMEDRLAITLAVFLKKKRMWMEWLKKMRTHENLLKELRLSEPSDFQNSLHLGPTCNGLLKMITPRISELMKT
jgi:hypothetical protein